MISKTNWEKIVSGKDLASAITRHSKIYIEKKERRVALEELQEEGWEEYKQYKNSKFVGVRKRKPFPEVFEDTVWLLFAKMGFTYMNADKTLA